MNSHDQVSQDKASLDEIGQSTPGPATKCGVVMPGVAPQSPRGSSASHDVHLGDNVVLGEGVGEARKRTVDRPEESEDESKQRKQDTGEIRQPEDAPGEDKEVSE